MGEDIILMEDGFQIMHTQNYNQKNEISIKKMIDIIPAAVNDGDKTQRIV